MSRYGEQSSDCNGRDEKDDDGGGGDDMAETTPDEQKTMLEDHAERDGQCQAVAAPKKQQRPSFREKHFTIEAPLLEHYFDVNDGKHLVLFNFFVAVFVLAAMAAWAQDFQRYGNPLHHLWLIAWNFHQLPQTMLVWSVMFCSTILLPFNGIWLWQCLAPPEAVWPRVVLIGAYVVYQLAFFFYSIRAIFWLDLQGACSFIITCENTRIAMKIHSFVRESLATSDKIGQKSENDEPPSSEAEQPGLKQFIYFMFCPTFIYRHSYPQSPTRSWHKVGRHLVACLASMYFVSLCFSQWIVPHFSALTYPEDIQWHLLVATIFPSIIPGAISLFLGVFYGILHSAFHVCRGFALCPLHHLWLIAWNFHQLPQTMLVWSVMFCSTVLLPFNGVWLWQCLAPPAAVWPRVVLIGAYVVYQLAFFFYSIRAIFWLDLQGACSFIITCENTRIAMKIHSFVRESLATSDKIGQKSENDETPSSESEQPGLKQFIYFMFCPTFIYRHSYPQSPTRSWHKVGRHLVACLASMYFVSLCFSQWIVPHFSALTYPEDIQWHLLVATIFPSIIPGAISLFLGVFYGILHSWLSMFAEALRFGDRRFYANWWSSRNMAEYYRNWNLVVHDWLYAYIYRDISMLLGTRWGPAVSQCLVFFLSSCFHEYWFAVSLRMFYPAIFTLYFIFGGVFFLISRMIKRQYIWNTLMWWNLLIGTGMFVVCYASEWYARQRCAQVHQSGTLVDIIVPRSWGCRRIS
uniref:O-acyltransferase n=1 Tax=Globodera pallida TaxID=36090 RepID=A0A183BUY9_GLOPA